MRIRRPLTGFVALVAMMLLSLLASPSVAVAADAAPPRHVAEAPANEATIVRLPDGELRIFYVVQPARSELRSTGSRDDGKTWGDDRLEFKLPGTAYYANQALVDSDGELHAVFHILGKGDKGYNGRHYDVWHARTNGGRKSWGEPKRVFEGYVGSMRGFAQLESGRLLLPVGAAVPERQKKPADNALDYGWNDVAVFYSDDKGDTWKEAPKRLSILQDNTRGRTRYGAVEPHVVQLADGRVWMLIRTKNGFLYESFSSDGVAWSEAKPSKFISSDSPATTARLKDGRLALFVNVCQRWDDPMSYAIGGREVLHGAISADEGKTWQGFREVLYDFAGAGKGDRGTAYPSATETGDGKIALVSGQGEGRKAVLIIDPQWLAQTSATSTFAPGEWPKWTTHEGKGAEVIDHPEKAGAKCLSLRRTDANAIAGATWNFPMATSGKLTLRVKPKPGFAAAVISLTDHYAVTGDAKADDNSVYTARLDAAALAAGGWHDVAFAWAPGGDATVTIDGKPAAPLKGKRQPAFGINYVRVSSLDEAGLLLDSAAVTGSPAGAGAVTRAPASPAPIRIVALGDSITKGARPARGRAPAVASDDTFAARLRLALAGRGISAHVINAGVGKNRTDHALARLDADVLAQDPDFVTVMYGTNDSCHDEGKSEPRIPIAQFESNLRAIVHRCQAAGTTPILMTPPPLTANWLLATEHPFYREHGANAALARYAEATRRVAKDARVPLVDHFAAWSARTAAELDALLPDGCHPSSAGHAVLAAAIAPVLLARANAGERSHSSQEFTKRRGGEAGGSVLDVGGAGAFDDKWATCPSVLRTPDGYRMYYSSYFNAAGGRGGIGSASSVDGVSWMREAGGKPVFPLGADGAFDAAQVFGPEVHHNGEHYLMWYTGDAGVKHASGIFHYQIGLATSRDGSTWTRANGGRAVLGNGGGGSPDEVQAATPSVLREGDGYRMWYAAWAPQLNHTICVARSSDGIRWERENGGEPVQGLDPPIAYGHAVARVGDTYVMLYMALEAARSLYGATSTDGTHWQMLNDGRPVLNPGAGEDFDANIVGHPYLLADGGILRAWYTGYQTKPGGIANWELRIGLAEAQLAQMLAKGHAR